MSANAITALPRALMTAAPKLTLAETQAWLEALEGPMISSGISTVNRVAAFLGQVAYESNGLKTLEEDLNYTAARLVEVWPGHFPNVAAAEPYAMQPEKLANLVYANRDGNGSPSSGDGFRYRGAGPIQLTFFDNYLRCARDLKMSPDALAAIIVTPHGGALTACWFWNDKKLNGPADVWNISAITRAVQGSTVTAPERLKLSEEIRVAIQAALAAG